MAKKEIFLEEAILHDLSEGLDIVEKPLLPGVFTAIKLFMLVFLSFVIWRCFYLASLNGDFYKNRALINAGWQTIIKAPRGIIYDRFGDPIVLNEPSFDLVVNLSQAIKNSDETKNELKQISEITGTDREKIYNDIVSSDLEHMAFITLYRNLSQKQLIDLKNMNSQSFFAEEDYKRNYKDGPYFSHLLGYSGLADKNDIKKNSKLDLNDLVGKSGLEAYYDNFLRGKNGFVVIYHDAKGNVINEKNEMRPQPGENVYSTIDSELQKYFFNQLQGQLASIGRKSGAGLAINPSTGEVLALVSLPSFDNNNITSDIFSNKWKPTFNRIVSGIYSPGSTIKPLVGMAALEEGIVTPETSVFSAGYIEIPNPYFPDKPSIFLDWKPHGWVNLYSALAKSSNVYFYEVGGGFQNFKGLGIDRLKEYWKKFKIADKSNIDLVGEAEGVLPDPQSKEDSTGDIWRIGDTYNVSIGQGNLMITPLSLLRYISSIATKGESPVPFIVKDIKNAKSGEEVYTNNPKFEKIDVLNKLNFDEIEAGMIDAVRKSYGTANVLSSVPMTIAAKTGSAQIQNNQKVNAFFVGYGPVPNPQIAVLVLIEDAVEGSLNAVPVARNVFEWYYENRLVNSDKR